MNLGYSGIPVEDALKALGAELRSRGAAARLVVVGGASLVLRGLTARLTGDVDVIAALSPDGDVLLYPHPLPPVVLDAARSVQRTLGLADPDWLNATVATSWLQRWPGGLPPGLLDDVEWRTFGTLEVGLAGRASLIPLKVDAVVGRLNVVFGPDIATVLRVDLSPDAARKHLGDLVALAPTDEELDRAFGWVREQNVSAHLDVSLAAVLAAVRDARV